jgi:predicted nucleotidyltransferase
MDTRRCNNGRMNSLKPLALDLGVSERTLRRAVSEHTLRGSRPSPRVLNVSFAERRYIRSHWPLLSRLRAALRTEPNVRLAVLFGSASAGTDTPRSDVDIAVELEDASIDRIADLTTKLERATGRQVDLVRLADIASEPTVLADVVEEGRVLVDRDDRWSRSQRDSFDLGREARASSEHRTRASLDEIDRVFGR